MPCNSLSKTIDRSRACPLKIHEPIGVPCLSRICRGSLFPMRRCRRNERPGKACPDRFAVHRALRKKRAHAILESPLDRWVERKMRKAAVDPPDRPFLRLRIERSNRGAVSGAGRPRKDMLFDVALPCHERPGCARSIEFLPCAVARTLHLMMHTPLTVFEIKAMHPQWTWVCRAGSVHYRKQKRHGEADHRQLPHPSRERCVGDKRRTSGLRMS